MKSVLLVCLMFFIGFSSAFANKDSTGLKIMTNNKVFIVHKVDKGNTLYNVAKRYGVTTNDILQYNPELKTAGLKLDQFIFIPTTLTPAQAEALMNKKSVDQKTEETANTAPKSHSDNVVYHTVAIGETLFSISKLADCKFNVEEIKKWNNLKSNALAEGQKLIIAFRTEVNVVPEVAVTKQEVNNIVEGKLEVENVDTKPKDDKQPSPEVKWSDEKVQGLATWVADATDDSGKSYALCNVANVGTVVRVVNLANEKVTYVRVIGPLSGNEAKDVVIVLTQTAAKKLEAQDSVIQVEIEYSNDDL